MKISTPGAKKQDEVPILPRFVTDCDSIVDLQDQNFDEKERVKAEIEALDQAKLVSGKASPVPQPAKIVMKKKVKKNSACQAVCDFIGYMIYPVVIFLIGVTLGKMLIHYKVDSQIERHNNLVRFVNTLQKNQGILYNGINDVMTKVSKLTENHNNTNEELLVVEYFINDLAKDLQSLKDSVKHIDEEKHHSDDDDDIVLDGDDRHYEDSDYPYPSSVIFPENQSTTEVTPSQSEEYFEDYSVRSHARH